MNDRQQQFDDKVAWVRSVLDMDVENGGYNFTDCATAQDRALPYHAEDVIAAILVTQSNLGRMALLLNRSRMGVDRYIKSNPEMNSFFNEFREGILDTVETNQFALALAGDGAAGRFLLTTIGKKRGYTTRQELTGEDGGAIPMTIERKIVDPKND